MNKKALKLLWIFLFFILGSLLFAVFIGAVLPWSFHDDKTVLERKGIVAAPVALICLIGLPGLALVLSNRGALPGTRR